MASKKKDADDRKSERDFFKSALKGRKGSAIFEDRREETAKPEKLQETK